MDNDSICTEPGSSGSGSTSGKGDKIPAVSQDPTATHPGPRRLVMQRLVSRERAITLRDEKMMEASNPNPRQLTISVPPTDASLRIKLPTTALTFENMALLSRELEVDPFKSIAVSSESTDQGSGVGGRRGNSGI